ncbi:hypothetical protein FRB94_009737 [Tulasnella sp. JGI-2019a]|nr:hypothetical protein FRB93_001153 [Tulasnella sp. JGI-2019a]KAG9010830.1 hypothetical protein FRB94_009737 [Tulasnella sp. JGI-2019a]
MDLDAIEEDAFLNVEPEVDDASKSAQKTTQLRPTLLSTISGLIASFDEKYPKVPAPSTLHAFSPEPPDTEILESILHASGVIATTLASHVPASDERFELRSREYTNHADSWFSPQLRVRDIFRHIALEKQAYGTDPPLDRAWLPGWVIEQIERLVKAAGMEVFPESVDQGRTTLACAGKILVMDIELLHEVRYAPMGPDELIAPLPEAVLELKELKISRASIGGDTTTPFIRHPPSERLLHGSLSRFIAEALKEDTNTLRLREAGETFRDQITPLLAWDNLASKEPGGAGERWFKEDDIVEAIGIELAVREAEAVANELSVPKAPLDIFLNRGHGLPLTCLHSPSMEFLVHMSARAYLSVSRHHDELSHEPTSPTTDFLDVSLSGLRAYLTDPNSSKDLATLATLTLSATPDNASSTNHLLPLLPPTFPLLSSSNPLPDHHLNHIFPVSTARAPTAKDAESSTAPSTSESVPPSTPSTKGFVLDFGKAGIVMRRKAMSQLAWVQDAGGLLGMDLDDNSSIIAEGSGAYDAYASPAWMDLLVDSGSQSRSQRYESYNTHATDRPPLHHFLTPPNESGFLLGQTRVSKMSEVWRILEVVKEQAWLNDMLRGFHWRPSSSGAGGTALSGTANLNVSFEDKEDDDLDAFLQRIQTPEEISVQVSVQATCPNPSIHFTVPLPRPGLPLLSFSVAYDLSMKRGVRVDIPQMDSRWKDDMEEIVRRGGISILAGCVWKKASESVSVQL